MGCGPLQIKVLKRPAALTSHLLPKRKLNTLIGSSINWGCVRADHRNLRNTLFSRNCQDLPQIVAICNNDRALFCYGFGLGSHIIFCFHGTLLRCRHRLLSAAWQDTQSVQLSFPESVTIGGCTIATASTVVRLEQLQTLMQLLQGL